MNTDHTNPRSSVGLASSHSDTLVVMKRALIALLALVAPLLSADRTIDDFFRDFTAEWIRGNPNLAASTRYFSGDEEQQFERQLTPETLAYKKQRAQLARRGLAELAKFDRSKMSDAQRVSADLL